MWIQKVPDVSRLAYAPDGRALYSRGRDAELIAWDITSRTSRKVTDVHGWASPDRRNLFPLADGRRVVWLDHYATVYDVNTGNDLGGVQRLTDHKAGLRRVTPAGRIFYVKSGAVAIAVWNLTSRDSEPQRDIPKAARRLKSYAISDDEQVVALVGTKGVVTLFDWGDGPELQNPVALGGTADTVEFSPGGETLALFSGQFVQMWDVERGAPRSEPTRIDAPHGAATFAFHPTAPMFVAVDRDKLPTLFDTHTGAPLRSFDLALGRVQCVAFSPDGLTCAVGGSNKQFAVFDVDV
jgi:WD40 repeat protein